MRALCFTAHVRLAPAATSLLRLLTDGNPRNTETETSGWVVRDGGDKEPRTTATRTGCPSTHPPIRAVSALLVLRSPG